MLPLVPPTGAAWQLVSSAAWTAPLTNLAAVAVAGTLLVMGGLTEPGNRQSTVAESARALTASSL